MVGSRPNGIHSRSHTVEVGACRDTRVDSSHAIRRSNSIVDHSGCASKNLKIARVREALRGSTRVMLVPCQGAFLMRTVITMDTAVLAICQFSCAFFGAGRVSHCSMAATIESRSKPQAYRPSFGSSSR